MTETDDCIACTYSGGDEQMYHAHGCPSCTCGKNSSLDPKDREIIKLKKQIEVLLGPNNYYANVENWECDMEGMQSYRHKIKDDSSNEAGMLRWVREIGGRRAREAKREFETIEIEFLKENPHADKSIPS